MSEDKKTLWGIPVVESDEVPRGEIILGSFPTPKDLLKYGSFEAAIEAQKQQWAKIKLDDEILAADKIE